MAFPWTVRPTKAAASTNPVNAKVTAATVRPNRTRGERRRWRELTRASCGRSELRGKRIARISGCAVRAPTEHSEPLHSGSGVAKLASECSHDDRAGARNDGRVVTRFVERAGLVRHLHA